VFCFDFTFGLAKLLSCLDVGLGTVNFFSLFCFAANELVGSGSVCLHLCLEYLPFLGRFNHHKLFHMVDTKQRFLFCCWKTFNAKLNNVRSNLLKRQNKKLVTSRMAWCSIWPTASHCFACKSYDMHHSALIGENIYPWLRRWLSLSATRKRIMKLFSKIIERICSLSFHS